MAEQLLRGHNPDKVFPQSLHVVYVELLACDYLQCSFCNVFDSVRCCITSWISLTNGPIQALLIAVKSLEVSTPQPGFRRPAKVSEVEWDSVCKSRVTHLQLSLILSHKFIVKSK